MRNNLFRDRTTALLSAVDNLPADRNPFDLKIVPPSGSMYPLLQIERLPPGLSLDWLASSLARQGIGMLPLSTFARTEKGFETGRKTFRLTLGGKDNAEVLQGKTRRLLIDLNRLIAEEDARYNRKKLKTHRSISKNKQEAKLSRTWDAVCMQIIQQCERRQPFGKLVHPQLDHSRLHQELLKDYLPERLDMFKTRLLDRARINNELISKALSMNGEWLTERLGQEFTKDSLQRRQELFKLRSYDRTVHPTQVYSLKVELALDEIVQRLIKKQSIPNSSIERVARE
jgi:hypothetical protein